jgi:hypothetical protein
MPQTGNAILKSGQPTERFFGVISGISAMKSQDGL